MNYNQMQSVFYGIDTSLFQDVHGVSALLSAAEMLSKQSPQISSAFVQFAAGLVENYLTQTGSSAEHDEAFAPLMKLSNQMKENTKTSAAVVERFADALIAASDGQTAIDFCRLAYLAYNSMSIFGQVPQRVLLKLSKVETMIGVGKHDLNLTFSSALDETDYQSPSQTQEIQQSQYIPTQTTQQLPQPPQFQPPPYNPPPAHYLENSQSTLSTQNIPTPNDTANDSDNDFNEQEPKKADTKTIESLAQIAKDAFSAGQMDVALTAINAAIAELQK
ncbi:hypothetical protein M9Y10_034847 [Tritrichomonas musculus]|uniref:Vta1 C-terminal domain-containing protein n=1 Tax=Tritrichomonas musculus TaxID=1915356 RepID=A0ABR2KH08_9EUKA